MTKHFKLVVSSKKPTVDAVNVRDTDIRTVDVDVTSNVQMADKTWFVNAITENIDDLLLSTYNNTLESITLVLTGSEE